MNKIINHTPGPWTYSIVKTATSLGRYASVHCGVKKDGRTNECWQPYLSDRSGEETAANARLMASAPEMLNVLRECKKMLHAQALKAEIDNEPFLRNLELLMVSQIIEKAEGKQELHK